MSLMRAKTPPGLNLKVPRLGINRYGVYYVRSAIVLPTGRRKVSQFSLNTKDASIAKLMALKFCLKLAETDLMHLDKNSSVRYEIDSLSGIVKADGPEEHARAMQALEIMQRAHLERLQLLSTLPPSSASLANELALQIQQSLIGQVSSASKPVIKTKLLKDALNDRSSRADPRAGHHCPGTRHDRSGPRLGPDPRGTLQSPAPHIAPTL